MNPWIFSMTWMFLRFARWVSSFTPSERIALLAALLVLLGVIGEEVAEFKFVEEENRARLKKSIKRWSVGILVLGLSGDVLGIVMGQAEMATLTEEAGDAAKSAKAAHDEGVDLLKKYEAAERELAEIKSKILPRRLSSGQKDVLRSRVAGFATKTISLACTNGGGEALDFEKDFVDAFRTPQSPLRLGEYLSSCNGITGGLPVPPVEIEFPKGRKDDADILLKALVDIGIKKNEIAINPNPNARDLTLTVGPQDRR